MEEQNNQEENVIVTETHHNTGMVVKFFIATLISCVFVCVVLVFSNVLDISDFILDNSSGVNEEQKNDESDNEQVINGNESLILSADKGHVQSALSLAISSVIISKKENVKLKGESVNLVVDNKLQDVGYDLKSVVAIGDITGDEYTIDMSNISPTINRYSDYIWTADDSGLISVYILNPEATAENRIATKIGK